MFPKYVIWASLNFLTLSSTVTFLRGIHKAGDILMFGLFSCVTFWPIAVLFIKYYEDGKYYLSKGASITLRYLVYGRVGNGTYLSTFYAMETYIMHFLEYARFLNAPDLAGRKVNVLYAQLKCLSPETTALFSFA